MVGPAMLAVASLMLFVACGGGSSNTPAPANTPAASTPRPVSTAAPGGGGGSGAITVEPIAAVERPGTVAVTAKVPANATCDLAVTLSVGVKLQADGLGEAKADAAGAIAWTFDVLATTVPGTARARVTCGSVDTVATFSIR
jgi:hypothetical protein